MDFQYEYSPEVFKNQNRSKTMQEELLEAKQSLAYWWFATLKLSDEYFEFCRYYPKRNLRVSKIEFDDKIKDTYEKFGDVFDCEFNEWWVKRGRHLFKLIRPYREAEPIKSIFELSEFDFNDESIILKIPLTIRKQTVLKQIIKQLDIVYGDREIDIQKNAPATIKYANSRVKKKTIELLLSIIELRRRFPNDSLPSIATKAGVVVCVNDRAENRMKATEDQIKRRLTQAVVRYTIQANNLMDNAVRGIFPVITPYQNPSA